MDDQRTPGMTKHGMVCRATSGTMNAEDVEYLAGAYFWTWAGLQLVNAEKPQAVKPRASVDLWKDF